MTLTDTEQQALSLLEDGTYTAPQLAERLGGFSTSYARDIVAQLRAAGHDVQNDGGGYYVAGNEPEIEARHSNDARRVDSSTKAATTRKAKSKLSEMEAELVERLNERPPATSTTEHTPGGTTVVFHRTDDHFGDEHHDEQGNVIYDSDVAEARVNRYFREGIARAQHRASAGEDIDSAALLLGGDMVTNESIYEGQAHDIDEDLYEQIERACRVYTENIRRLSDRFDHVKVVCQAGNHGELRASGASAAANADDILYLMLDNVIRASGLDNVTFIQSDRTYYVNFSLRDWNAHLRHGHDASLEHIGTSAGKQRWLSWLVDHDFDVAFRGHYHMLKQEPINGVPVVMGGSITPQSEFEESRAMSGRPAGAIHGVTDAEALDWTERIYLG